MITFRNQEWDNDFPLHDSESQLVRGYRSILHAKLKEAGLTQKEIATRMGWASQSTVSEKLNGKRDWSEGELTRMCEIAGITVLWLAENSDDLVITKSKQSLKIASMADSLTEAQLAAVISLMESMKN